MMVWLVVSAYAFYVAPSKKIIIPNDEQIVEMGRKH
jgi:hypothetical protein